MTSKYVGIVFETRVKTITPVHNTTETIFPKHPIFNSQPHSKRQTKPFLPSPKPFYFIYLSHVTIHTTVIFPLVLANGRELKHNVLARQLLVHLAKSIDLIIDARALLGVQEDLDDLMTVLLSADPLAHDLGGVDKVREDRIMDGSEGARSRALLGDAAAARGEREDTTLSDKQDVAVGEFLLKLTRESSLRFFVSGLKSAFLGEGG